ncbi:MAG: methionine adenosyltransferase [Planctomycetia bacterium]|nr:methionine adenosyltransferase [Planctomycetia bacterium]
MPESHHLFTSESVAVGHPDKIADQLSDAILDEMLKQDPASRVACECMVTTGLAMIAGEITTKAVVDIPSVVRATIRDIGYTDAAMGFDAEHCSVLVALDKQSPDIAMGVDADLSKGKEQGAGDQGIMMGYASRETPELMPMPIQLAHQLCNRLKDVRESGEINWLRPDGKSQVTVEYDEQDKPVRIHTVVISAQHSPDVAYDTIRHEIIERVIQKVIPAQLLDAETIYHINPTGRFVVGGPQGDCGLTGRKLIVDTYGGKGSHGGGAFSGKDPSKVDRSAAYMCRHIAKNIVAADLADECEVQLSYAIGVAEPLSVRVETSGTGELQDVKIARLIREVFPLTPRSMIEYLDLLRPIYKLTASGGHFGRELPEVTWERIDRVEDLRRAASA